MTQPTILVAQMPITESDEKRIRDAAGDMTVIFERQPAPSLILDAEVVAGRVPPEILATSSGLRWNHLWTAGADADLSAEMEESAVILTSSAGNGAIPLAEHALLLMMMLNRDVPRWMRAQQERRWDSHRHGELAGKTVGIIGMGNAGRDLAVKCAAFHMRVLGLRNRPEIPADCVERMFGPAEITELAAQCDFVVVAAPLTESTRALIDADVFEAMPATAYIVNISRGEIIDSDAMFAALTDDSIAGAGLDAHAVEPLPSDSPWWDAPRVIVTPHNGATTPQTLSRAVDIFVENLERYRRGEPLINVVDKTSGYAP